MSQPSLLVVDDEIGVRESIRLIFNKSLRLHEARSGEEALQKVKEEMPDVILLDIMMPGSDGLETLRKIKEIHPDGQVVMLTALNTARTAFTAKETGAFDYVTKPFDVDELRLRIDRALEKAQLAREVERLQEEVGRRYGIENIVGNSKPMMEIYKTVSLVAKRKSTVLITGESGTGKELIARAIHYNSDRRNKAFVVVNCAALPDSLIESELFGYEKGAFTNAYQRKIGHFESANGGTLFLDEIGELNLGTQAKLLRAIETETFIRLGGNEESKVDVRIIAASNRELEKLSRDGGFRADLFYRLNVVSLCLPSLRERRDDIALLVDHFLKLKARENGIAAKKMGADVVDRLVSYAWPGNVRELENLIERLTILTASDAVALGDLPIEMRSIQPAPGGSLKDEVLEGSRPLGEAVDEFERAIILKALKKTGFNQTKAAALLGTSRRVLRYRMEKLQIAEGGPVEEDCAKLSS
ncbi:MAG TPA: sigma-54 dependent transcriptional regulator [Candidatus Binatia bacterium]|jgi:DNA-binding NtrC family response regulator